MIHAPLGKLYTFQLVPEVFAQFRRVQDRYNRTLLDRSFKSLEILKEMVETQ